MRVQRYRRSPRRGSTRRQFLLLGGASLLASLSGGFLALRVWESLQGGARVVVVTATPSADATPEGRPPIVPREDWGALPPNHQAARESGFYSVFNPAGWRVYPGDLRDSYQTVVIHHSVTYEGDDERTLLAIQNLHREDRRWADVAYHYFVGKTGTIYAGRDVSVRGAHVGGYNTGSLGVCLLGNFMTENPSAAQLDATKQLIRWASASLGLTHLAAHRDFNAGTTQCPGDKLAVHLPSLAAEGNLSLGTAGYIGG